MNTLFPLSGLLLFGSSTCFAAPDSAPIAPEKIAAPALFSDAERAQSVAYWNAPDRYRIGPRQSAGKEGVFAVRLTPQASLWFSAFNRALKSEKIAAPKNAVEITPATRVWEDWVAAKLRFDRALAAQQVQLANTQLLDAPPAVPAAKSAPGANPNLAPDSNFNSNPYPALRATIPTATIPTATAPTATAPTATAPTATAPTTAASPLELPPHPGPIPLDLLAVVGNAPPFAAPVAPLRHSVQFESGETINFTDFVLTVNPRNPSFRFAQGVALIGTALSKIAPAELERVFAAASLSPSQTRVMRAVSLLEGGFDSINTYDTGFVSVGFIQFAALENGDGSLATLLQREKARNPLEFAGDFHDFGVDVSDDGALVVVDPSSGAQLSGAEAVRKIIDDKRLTAVFHRAGKRSVAFRAAQIEVAKTNYYPADLPVEVRLGGQILKGLVRDVVQSEAGMATLFDRKVNVGNVRILGAVLGQLMLKHNLTRLEQIAPFEREWIAALKWRRDFLKDATLTQPA